MARSAKIKQLPPVTCRVESLAHDGRGVARIDGKAIFVHGALPGETVRVAYTARHRRHDEACTLEVLEASPDRVRPRCPHFGVCGGCSLQHLRPQAQVAAKRQVLAENLGRIGGIEPERWLEPLEGPHWAYRRRARLGLRHVEKKGRMLIGFREYHGRLLADLEHCDVLVEKFGNALRDWATLVGGLAGFNRVPQIEVAAGDERHAMVIRHLVPLADAERARLLDYGRTAGIDVYLQPGNEDSVHPLGEPEPLAYRLPEFEIELQFRPTDFVQVNPAINRDLVRLAIDLLELPAGARVLDLFCGLGNFTLALARHAGEAVGVEGHAGLVARARENAVRNGIANATFHAADLARELDQQPWVRQGFSHVLLDPPRAGALETLPYLPRIGAERVVYVSCNPATLARDAGELVRQHGYRLVAAGVLDMFPHTAHVESIAVFQRR